MNEDQLVTRLKGKHPEAVQELVSAYGDRLLRSAFLLCGNEAEAQDIVQDTFLQAMRSVHRFRGQSTIYTWLHAILLNLTRHYHRKHQRMVYDDTAAEREIVLTDENPAGLDAGAASSALREALGQLSDAHREVIILRYYEDMKLHEIASHLGISKGTVKSRLHHAIGQMQKFLPGEMNLFGAAGTNLIEKR
jgi:RNA polymerase sigma-70 factor (ECF subfamily)